MLLRFGLALLVTGLTPAFGAGQSGAPGLRSAAGAIGWYNGDCDPNLAAQPSYFFSDEHFARVYDDFVVPSGGWTVLGLFTDMTMDFTGVTRAAWEIRKEMAPGKGGQKVASGLSPAVQVPLAGAANPETYRIQVAGLRLRLAPGRYWLSVAPVGRGGLWYTCPTSGQNAIGDPAGNNGLALLVKTDIGYRYVEAEAIPPGGPLRNSGDFSQGVIVDGATAGRAPAVAAPPSTPTVPPAPSEPPRPTAPDVLQATPVEPEPPAASEMGWYNGDWQSGLRGLANWYVSGEHFARVYDDFAVSEGGWTVLSVFSDNRMTFTGVTQAAWEIRRDMAPGEGGRIVASGVSRAAQVPLFGEGASAQDAAVSYRILVQSIHVRLEPGRYWLSVAPLRGNGTSFIEATLGKNAVGDPPGNDGQALVFNTEADLRFVSTADLAADSRPTPKDFSQGVIIEARGNAGRDEQ